MCASLCAALVLEVAGLIPVCVKPRACYLINASWRGILSMSVLGDNLVRYHYNVVSLITLCGYSPEITITYNVLINMLNTIQT